MIVLKVIIFIALSFLFGYILSNHERNKLEAFKEVHELEKEKQFERRDKDLQLIGMLNGTIRSQREAIRKLDRQRALRIVEKK